MKDKYPVLFTRNLNAKEIEYARLNGIEPTIKPAIQTVFPRYWDHILGFIARHQRASWAFTSQNAVEALGKMMQQGLHPPPGISTYAVGSKTKDALEKLGIQAKAPAQNSAGGLADLIKQENSADTVLYFRGNKSLKTLQKELEKERFEVIDAEVYKTHLNEITVPDRHFEAVVFYSPSAVESFDKSSGFSIDWPNYVAIGPTTGSALQKVIGSKKRVHYPSTPDTRILINLLSNIVMVNQ